MPKGTDDLQGLGVLVTRPAEQADHLCQLIEKAGGRPYRLPTITIEPGGEAELQQARGLLGGLQQGDLLIFISANAVQHAQPCLSAIQDWSGLQTAVIGKATARVFEQAFGRPPDLLPREGSNSEALLALPKLQQLEGRRVIIVRGEGGRALLGDTLQQRGAEVHYANVYRRVLPKLDIASQADELRARVDVITTTSVESLQNLVQLLAEPMGEWLWSRPLFVIHPRQLEAAQQMGFKIIAAVADETSDEALLSAIIKWRQQTT
jgi:uroporphyrinogen-III synthase